MTPSEQEPEPDAPTPSGKHLIDWPETAVFNPDVPTTGIQEGQNTEPPALIDPETVRDAIDLLMAGESDLRPRLNGRSPLPAPDGCPDVRAWAEAVVAEVWDQTVRLAWGGPTAPKPKHDWGPGIFALRQVEAFYEDVVGRINRTMDRLDSERVESSDLWADPNSEEEEDLDLLQDQRGYWRGIDSNQEAAEDRLGFVLFELKVIRSILWSVVSHGSVVLWRDEPEDLRDDILNGTDTAEPDYNRVGVGYAALMVYALDKNPKTIKTIGQWQVAVGRLKNPKLIKLGLPTPENMMRSIKEAAIALLEEPKWLKRASVGKSRIERFGMKTDIIRRLAVLYNGPKDEKGCPLPPR